MHCEYVDLELSGKGCKGLYTNLGRFCLHANRSICATKMDPNKIRSISACMRSWPLCFSSIILCLSLCASWGLNLLHSTLSQSIDVTGYASIQGVKQRSAHYLEKKFKYLEFMRLDFHIFLRKCYIGHHLPVTHYRGSVAFRLSRERLSFLFLLSRISRDFSGHVHGVTAEEMWSIP